MIYHRHIHHYRPAPVVPCMVFIHTTNCLWKIYTYYIFLLNNCSRLQHNIMLYSNMSYTLFGRICLNHVNVLRRDIFLYCMENWNLIVFRNKSFTTGKNVKIIIFVLSRRRTVVAIKHEFRTKKERSGRRSRATGNLFHTQKRVVISNNLSYENTFFQVFTYRPLLSGKKYTLFYFCDLIYSFSYSFRFYTSDTARYVVLYKVC